MTRAALLVATAVIGLVLGSMYLRNRAVELPKPTGPFPVGRILFELPGEGAPLWIWYPAREGFTAPRAAYFPETWSTGLFRQNLGTVRPHAMENAPISRAHGTYPLVVLMPDEGAVPPMYTAVAEELASHGLIVAGITPPNSSEPKEQRVGVWADRIRRVIDRASEVYIRVGLGPEPIRFGALGHGFGGAATAEACLRDARLAAGMNLDGRPYGEVSRRGMTQAFLTLWSEASFMDAGEDVDIHRTSLSRSAAGYLLRVRGMRRANFMDRAIFFQPSQRWSPEIGSIGGDRGLRLTVYYAQRFFNSVLWGKGPPLPYGPTPEFPEVFWVHY